MSVTLPEPAPTTRPVSSFSRPVVRGLLWGGLGGGVGGAVAGLAGLGPYTMAVPTTDAMLQGAALAGPAGLAIGAACGAATVPGLTRILGRRGASATVCGCLFLTLTTAVNTAYNHGLGWGATVLVFSYLVLLAVIVSLTLVVRLLLRSRIARWGLVTYLLVCLVGVVSTRLSPPPAHASLKETQDSAVVQLWCSPIPVLGHFARHHWFAAFDPATGRWHRWEVWQEKDAGDPGNNWGHVHRDLMAPWRDTGGGPPVFLHEWKGEDATRLLAALADSHRDEEHCRLYIPWPGPNCNSYIRAVFDRAGVPIDMDPTALGRDYRGPVSASVTTTGTGVQMNSPAVGVKVGVHDGLEVQLAGFTAGADFWPPAVKTPVGRLGFPE